MFSAAMPTGNTFPSCTKISKSSEVSELDFLSGLSPYHISITFLLCLSLTKKIELPIYTVSSGSCQAHLRGYVPSILVTSSKRFRHYLASDCSLQRNAYVTTFPSSLHTQSRLCLEEPLVFFKPSIPRENLKNLCTYESSLTPTPPLSIFVSLDVSSSSEIG